ncbi:MAG TPA: peptide-N4-asparagine amidase [Terracidiphilus sp.]|nr:peptide-N4-asparagine amidase [Terracidiphilus sp.]
MNYHSPLRLVTLLSAAAISPLFMPNGAPAQVVTVPSTPQIGSSNPITAEPPVPRPHTKPCVVQLFQNQAFADFTPKSFSYTPPASCHGPWAKVVFTADFTVQSGRQFDRTAAFYLGHASIYYGTTAEPRAALSPSWHIERDVTDLSAILQSPQTGEANLGNFVGVSGGVTYNSIIFANAALEFYPASFLSPAPRTPDIVVPVNGSGGDAGTLNTGADQVTQTLNLPTNTERVYLDVIAQSQSNDEFWYLCVPNDQTANLESCGNTAFREAEISIDGTPAGVAPVSPWIFTGGIDPYLWEPIPGVQTLDFKPYRVDLTPFAGLLADGKTHTVAISVFNANSYFLATANLLVFTDHASKKVTGGVLRNDLAAAPTPVVTESIDTTSSGSTGTVTVGSKRNFTLSGYVNTSHGRVETTIQENVNFVSKQSFNVAADGSADIQDAVQTSSVDSLTTTRDGWFDTTLQQHISYPLAVDYSFVVNGDGSLQQVVTIDQHFLNSDDTRLNGFPVDHHNTSNEVNATDTLSVNAAGVFSGPTNSKTTQTFFEDGGFGGCYSRTLTAVEQVLTSVVDGQGCHGDHSHKK